MVRDLLPQRKEDAPRQVWEHASEWLCQERRERIEIATTETVSLEAIWETTLHEMEQVGPGESSHMRRC